MLHIYLYGFLKKRFVPNAKLSESTMIEADYKEGESFKKFLVRLNIDPSEIGDCFINSKLAFLDDIIPKNARIDLFGLGMSLLDGGQYIKGHGHVTKHPPFIINSWNS